MDAIFINIFKYLTEIFVFLVLLAISTFIYNAVKNSHSRIFNPIEYFPEEEVHTLKQIFYLIMMGLFFVDIIYAVTYIYDDIIYFVIFDLILSLYLAIRLDKSTTKNKILLFLLIPYGGLTFLIFGKSLVGIMDIIHIPVFIYFIKLYYDKFREYTESNGLGITMILLFAIIFISFFTTQITEGVNPLDSLNMVSNAFTSNGYTVLGHSIPGKINSIILVWSGYLLSGVGTATLTAAILMKHFNSKFDRLEALIEKNNED